MAAVRTGIDRLIDGDVHLDGSRFGILTNDAARVTRMPHLPARKLLVDAFESTGRGQFVRLFSPEHGIATRAADGTAVADAVDAVTGLPIVSLYGERLKPLAETVSDLDAVLFDVPDAGARFYTYIWTLTHLIDACAETGTTVIVLDRPNPQSGDLSKAEGPILDLSCCESFLGRMAIPITHQLTLGEMALLWKAEHRPEADVRVVAMKGWTRQMSWEKTGLPFVAPSPALQTSQSVALYPGLCFLEAFNVSIGRGSKMSFEAAGAPWMNPDAIIEAFSSEELAGVDLERVSFSPSIHPYSGQSCRGIRFRIHDPTALRPVALGMHLVRALHAVHPDRLEEARYPTVANPSGEDHLSLLIGDRRVAGGLAHSTGDDIISWTGVSNWRERVSGVLIYGEDD
jgi:uncharacterized protein YbbC (DUF1343 family)